MLEKKKYNCVVSASLCLNPRQ